jgi:hypothetical protein
MSTKRCPGIACKALCTPTNCSCPPCDCVHCWARTLRARNGKIEELATVAPERYDAGTPGPTFMERQRSWEARRLGERE